MKELVFLAVFLGVAFAQLPPRCVSPSQWEGRVVEIDPSRRFERRAKLSYDATNQRVRFVDEVFINETKDYFDDLFIYKDKTGYHLNLKTRECEKFTLSEPFEPIEVPTEAEFEGEGYIGVSGLIGAGMLVDVWGGETQRGRYSGTWTEVLCVPVTDTYVSRRTGFVHSTFFDITLGISDPNVFIPPSECMKM